MTAGPGIGDPMLFGAGMNSGACLRHDARVRGDEAALMIAMENGTRRGVRASAGDRARSPRRSARKSPTKPTRRQSSAGSNSR